MISMDDIEYYLPKYLSVESQPKLFNELNDFPSNIDQRMYSVIPHGDNIIFQGDGLSDLLVINFPDKHIQAVPSMVLSNTCDIDIANKRMLEANIIYVPIIAIQKYRSLLLSVDVYSETSIESHIESIRKQRITSIFYLPPSDNISTESMVFLDRINNYSNTYLPRECISSRRLFSLSQYGHYLFLIKLSIHFTRIQEKIDRSEGLQS